MSLRSILLGGFSFLLGFIFGRKQSSRTTEYNASPVTENSNAEVSETDQTEPEEDKTSYTCTVDGCTDTFESEHGRNVHEGIAH